MSFLDKKEDVIDIELTQYGKYLLSLGKFNPKLYAFYDDDIVYDSRYAGYAEAQNEAEYRIQEIALRTKTQYTFSGIETEIKKLNKIIRNKKNLMGIMSAEKNPLTDDYSIQRTAEKHYSLSAPLGNSSLSSNKTPAISLAFLMGTLTGSVHYTSSSYIKAPQRRIAQLDSNVEYRTWIELEEDVDSDEEDIGDAAGEQGFSEQIEIERNSLLLELCERNVPPMKEAFEIEVFEVTSSALSDGEAELLVPLSFAVNGGGDNIFNEGLSVGEEELSDLDSSYVEYYFNIFVDDEVSEGVICSVKKKDRLKCEEGMYDDIIFECPDEDEMRSTKATDVDIYGIGTITEADFEDECED